MVSWKKNKIITQLSQSLVFFVLICTIWVGVFFILPDFLDNPFKGFKGFVITFLYWGAVSFSSGFLIYLMAINKYVFAAFFPVFSMLGATIGFYRHAFKASLTPMLIEATFNASHEEVTTLISPQLIVFVSISFVISIFLVFLRFKKIKAKHHYLHLFIACIGLILVFNLSGRLKTNLFQRFPYNVYYSLSEYWSLRKSISQERIDFDPEFVCQPHQNGEDSLAVILVLGEAARADHFSLNGYHRDTNPLLAKRKNLHSLPNVYSHYTYTNASLPHILTRADSVNLDLAFNECSFISLFNKCNFRTEWISNQEASTNYVFFMNECDTIIYAHPEKSVYNFNYWLDVDLLPFVEQALDTYSKNLLVLHTIGSHWYYNYHYPKEFEYFTPVTSSRIITQNTKEEIINSYDNTILYTDYFLDILIEMLMSKNAILIYIADHGEVLGEDNLWLHAADHEAAKYPACLVWMSEKYIYKNHDKLTALMANKDKKWKTDFVFHSILSAANIPSAIIQADLDIFSTQE